MLKKTMTYEDYNGVPRTEDFYFNLTPAEVTEMELSVDGGLVEMINRVVAAQDGKQIINVFKDIGAGLRNFFGGRSAGYEEELQNARNEALDEMCQRAERMGANAVVGVDIDYEVLGSDNGMLMVSASGTAVVI